MERYVKAPMENHDVGEMVSTNILQVKTTNTNNLLKISSNIKFLSKEYPWNFKPRKAKICCFTSPRANSGLFNLLQPGIAYLYPLNYFYTNFERNKTIRLSATKEGT